MMLVFFNLLLWETWFCYINTERIFVGWMFSQVIAVAKSSDIVLMVLDASKVSAIWHFLK